MMYRLLMVVGVLLLVSPVLADHFDSGSDGSDGPLNCETLGLTDCANECTVKSPCEAQILLGSAFPAPWNTESPDEGEGVYDADEWVVVYKYTEIDIPRNVIVTFGNHPSGAPVVWLASGDVTIAGSVRVDGADAPSGGSGFAVPGPGGFGGGIGRDRQSAGFGPGGGSMVISQGAGGGGYGSPGEDTNRGGGGVAYGKDSLAPLIGGSGGGAWNNNNLSGGAGGGAILIASSGDFTLASSGGIFANGGEARDRLAGSGSGGGIRLVAHAVTGSGMLRAVGGTQGRDGGDGRIHIDGGASRDIDSNPPISGGFVGPIFPQAAARLRATVLGGSAVPVDPLGTVFSDDVGFITEGSVDIVIEARNVPVGLTVTVRIVPKDGDGDSSVLISPPLVGTFELSTATVRAKSEFVTPGPYEVYLSVQVP